MPTMRIQMDLGRLTSFELDQQGVTLTQYSGQEQFGSERTDRVHLTLEQWSTLKEAIDTWCGTVLAREDSDASGPAALR